MNITSLSNVPINRRVIEFLQRRGIVELFEPQQSALETGVLEGNNLVLAVPTSSGKTLVAEICMLKSILDGRGKALYLVPLRSLAREKYLEFKQYRELGITVAVSVGDYDSPGTRLKDADIIVLTTERADSIIRHNAQWIREIGVIVCDEVHLINDSSRGPTLEMVLAKLRQMLQSVQIVALSATISNADEIASWLDAELVRSDWRPVPLNEGVYLNGSISFSDGTSQTIQRSRSNEIANIVCDTIEEGGQSLVFVSTRRSTIAVAKKIASAVRPYVTEDGLVQLSKIADKIDRGPNVPEVSKILARVLRLGAAFHHAGLSNEERTLVEDSFKDDFLKVIVATPTLAAGVNLPARRVVIRDYRRYEGGRGYHPIPILEYKQMAGRAGRPKYDEYGEAVLVAKNSSEQNQLMDNYVYAEPEDITSKLASPSAVCSHVLASISAEMTQTREEIDKLIDGTFFSEQFDRYEIDYLVSSALDFLEEGELISSGAEGLLVSTALGKKASRLYIDPRTAILFRDRLSENDESSPLGLLHLICSSVDQPLSFVRKSESEEYQVFIEDNADEFLTEPPDVFDEPYMFSKFLAQAKTARLLFDWISETRENVITERYNVGMGDVHRYVQSAEWLLYASGEIAKTVDTSQHVPLLYSLRKRVKYGVRADLLELVSIRGVGRVRGRMLASYGLDSLAKLYDAAPETIAQVPTIGTTLAVSIKKQLGVAVDVSAPSDKSLTTEEPDGQFQTLLDDFESQ